MKEIVISQENIEKIRKLGVEAVREIADRVTMCGQQPEVESRLMAAYGLGYERGLKEAMNESAFKVGDKVSKTGGDYRFDGIVVSVFTKQSGLIRLVVEDDRGILHVYSEKNLKLQEQTK